MHEILATRARASVSLANLCHSSATGSLILVLGLSNAAVSSREASEGEPAVCSTAKLCGSLRTLDKP